MYASTYVCMCSNDMNAEMRLEEGKILMGYWKTKETKLGEYGQNS